MGALLILAGMLMMLHPLLHHSSPPSRPTFVGTSRALRRIFRVPYDQAPEIEERLRALGDHEINAKG